MANIKLRDTAGNRHKLLSSEVVNSDGVSVEESIAKITIDAEQSVIAAATATAKATEAEQSAALAAESANAAGQSKEAAETAAINASQSSEAATAKAGEAAQAAEAAKKSSQETTDKVAEISASAEQITNNEIAINQTTDMLSNNYYGFVKQVGYYSADNMVDNSNLLAALSNTTVSGIEITEDNGTITYSGTSTQQYPNVIFKCPIESGHKYLFALSTIERSNIAQQYGLAARYTGAGPQDLTRTLLSGFNPRVYRNQDITSDWVVLAAVFTAENQEYDYADFSISFDIPEKTADMSAKNICVCDVTDFTDEQILKMLSSNLAANKIIVYGKNVADDFSDDAKSIIKSLISEQKSNWAEKRRWLSVTVSQPPINGS